MDKTPEQILEEVETINPNDLYIKGIEYLIENKDKKYTILQFSIFFKAWALGGGLIQGSQLFRYGGKGKNDNIAEENENRCGCLTQMKMDSNQSYNMSIYKALIQDHLIPFDMNSETMLTEEQLYRFAKWQTWLDQNIEDRRSVEEFLNEQNTRTDSTGSFDN